MSIHIQRPKNTGLYTGFQIYVEYLTGRLGLRDGTMVEIGSYQGESTEIFATAFSKVYAIDPWINGYDDRDISSYITPMHLVESAFDSRMANYPNVIKRKGKSQEILSAFISDHITVDFVYIDGAHIKEEVLSDLHYAAKITKYIGGHDWGHPEVTAALLEFFNASSLDGLPFYLSYESSWVYTNQFI